MKRTLLLAAIAATTTLAIAQERPAPPSLVGLGAGTRMVVPVGTGTVHNALVREVGMHAAHELAFFMPNAPLPDCQYETIYIPLGPQGGRVAYATVLSAARSDAGLSRVTYVVQSDGICTLDVLAS